MVRETPSTTQSHTGVTMATRRVADGSAHASSGHPTHTRPWCSWILRTRAADSYHHSMEHALYVSTRCSRYSTSPCTHL